MVAGLEERRWGNIPLGSLAGSGELGSGLRREVRVIQKDISSGLGNIVPLDTGLIHQAGLCPKMAETSRLCCVRMWMEWPDCKEPRIRPLKHLPIGPTQDRFRGYRVGSGSWGLQGRQACKHGYCDNTNTDL